MASQAGILLDLTGGGDGGSESDEVKDVSCILKKKIVSYDLRPQHHEHCSGMAATGLSFSTLEDCHSIIFRIKKIDTTLISSSFYVMK